MCIDVDADNRRFMYRAWEHGVSGAEYVYLMPSYVRFENQTNVWMDRTIGTTALGSNADARISMQNVLFVSTTFLLSRHLCCDSPAQSPDVNRDATLQFEMLLSADAELFSFKKEVIQRIKGWPYFYTESKLNEDYVRER